MRFRALLLAVGLVVVSQPAWAALIAYEGFTPTFPAFNGGIGFSGPWSPGAFTSLASDYLTSGNSLSYDGLQTSGGSVFSMASSDFNGATRNLAQALGANNTTVYVSVLLQPQGTLNIGPANGFFGLTLNGSLGSGSNVDALFMGKPGGGATGQYVLEQVGGSGQVTSGVAAVVGQTAFLVVKAQFLSGNDRFTLYTNPIIGAPEPTSGVSKTDLDLGTVSGVSLLSTGSFAVDEIRIGTTYADVTPAALIPEPTTGILFLGGLVAAGMGAARTAALGGRGLDRLVRVIWVARQLGHVARRRRVARGFR